MNQSRRLLKKFSTKKDHFIFKHFEGHHLDKAINLLIYGVSVKDLTKSKNQAERVFIYIKENNIAALTLFSLRKKVFKKMKIKLRQINNINDYLQSKSPYITKKENSLNIFYNSNKSSLLIEFEDNDKKMLFWEGLQYFYQLAKSTVSKKFQCSKI